MYFARRDASCAGSQGPDWSFECRNERECRANEVEDRRHHDRHRDDRDRAQQLDLAVRGDLRQPMHEALPRVEAALDVGHPQSVDTFRSALEAGNGRFGVRLLSEGAEQGGDRAFPGGMTHQTDPPGLPGELAEAAADLDAVLR